MNILSPSLLSIDFNHIARNAKIIDKAGAQWFHLDVMDGLFVRNITFGPPVIKSMREITDRFFDVHLMIMDPIRYVDAFKDAGADSLTVHYESCQNTDVRETIDYIKEQGMKAAIAISPGTPVSTIEDIITDVDMVLVMSVEPGFGGQKFMPIAIDKLKQVREIADKVNPSLLIEVDGGITLDNVEQVIQAGANVVVAGSAVFKNDQAENVKAFLKMMNE